MPRSTPAQSGKGRCLTRFSIVAAASLLAIGGVRFAGCASAEQATGDATKLAAFEQSIPGTDAKFKMLPIPAGTFMMGSPESEKGRKGDEGPQHEVQVEPFFMEEHEVTWAEYQPFLDNYNRLSAKPTTIPANQLADAVTYPTPMYEQDAAPRLERMGGRGPKFPAVILSQFAAKQYTKWLSKKTGRFYRLPCEAEWEYACRAGTKAAYFFGDDPAKLKEYAWFNDNSQESDGDVGYHPVMSKKPNPWGLYDMYGNVAEWCIDQYAEDWYKQFTGKTTPARDTINWPRTQYPRVLRGGGFASEAAESRSAFRLPSDKSMNEEDPQNPKSPHWLSDGFYIGFRVVSPLKEPTEDEKHKWWDVDDPKTKQVIQRDRERRDVPEKGAQATP